VEEVLTEGRAGNILRGKGERAGLKASATFKKEESKAEKKLGSD